MRRMGRKEELQKGTRLPKVYRKRHTEKEALKSDSRRDRVTAWCCRESRELIQKAGWEAVHEKTPPILPSGQVHRIHDPPDAVVLSETLVSPVDGSATEENHSFSLPMIRRAVARLRLEGGGMRCWKQLFLVPEIMVQESEFSLLEPRVRDPVLQTVAENRTLTA